MMTGWGSSTSTSAIAVPPSCPAYQHSRNAFARSTAAGQDGGRPLIATTITGFAAPPSGNYQINRIRIYRTQTGASGATEFFFLREISAATTSTTDDARARGARLATYDGTAGSAWLVPPDAGFGILALWNGIHAMLSPGKLHLCVPNAPYAWPAKHHKALKSGGIALGKWGQNLAVLVEDVAPPL